MYICMLYIYIHTGIYMYVYAHYIHMYVYMHTLCICMATRMHAMISLKECQRSKIKYSTNLEAKADSDHHRINF